LLALAKLGYPAIRVLLKQSWETVDVQYHKIGCLLASYEYIKDPILLNEYLVLAAMETGDELKNYVFRIIENMQLPGGIQSYQVVYSPMDLEF
jgi:hypothetical protein